MEVFQGQQFMLVEEIQFMSTCTMKESTVSPFTGSWFKGDLKAIIDEALATGQPPEQSNSLTINGQPGDLYPCSAENTYRYRQIRLPSDYYMASISFSDANAPIFDNTTTTAILQYNGNYTTPSAIPLPLLPRFDDSAAAESFTERTGDAASMNNVSFEAKPIDILQAYYRSIDGVFDRDFPSEPPKYYNFTGNMTVGFDITTAKGTKVTMLNYGESVEIVFQGTNLRAAMNHPIHLHGFSFYLVGTGKGNFNNVTDPKSYNLIDPPEINTVALPKSGWAAIRFVADNPGKSSERYLSPIYQVF
ncbi:hypothetical protein OIU76_023556 [Salix suchowensis]|nr:hypothetical protein OIU76_023556 [Salix suchowensis]